MRVLLGVLLLEVGLLLAPPVHACSPARISLYQQYNNHSRVFLGTVRAKAQAPEGAYELSVEEAFKGFLGPARSPAAITVAFDLKGQCGFDAPKLGTRVLVFMNEGDVVSSTSGSRFIWSESAQTKPHLNPVWDDVILLRAMLDSGPVVADTDTAIHIALKTLRPVMGAEALASRLPLQAEYQADGKTFEERVWKVRAKDGKPLLELNKVNGDVVRVEP